MDRLDHVIELRFGNQRRHSLVETAEWHAGRLKQGRAMVTLPSLPVGSTIERQHQGGDIRLILREATMHPARKLYVAFCGLIALTMAVPVTLFIMLPSTDLKGTEMPLPMLVAIVIVQSIFAAILIGPVFISRAPESVTLSDESISHDTGSPVLPLPTMIVFGPFIVQLSPLFGTSTPPVHWRRRQRAIPHAAISNIRLERIDGRQRLTFDHGADRIEVGAGLREPEREWLAEVLDLWHSRG